MSFSKKKSKQSSTQRAEDYGTDVWGPQQEYLQNLWSQAQGLAGGAGTGAGDYLQGAMNPALNQQTQMAQQAAQGGIGAGLGMAGAGAGATQGLLGQNPLAGAAGGFGQAAGAMGQAMQNLGGYGTQGYNPFANAAVQSAGQQLGQQFREQFLPQSQGQAIQAGGLGGSRQQIGEALGAERFGRQLTDYATQVGLQGYEGQMARQQQALAEQGRLAQGLGGLAQGYGQLGQQQYATQAGLAGQLGQLGQGLYGTGAGIGGQLAGQQTGLQGQLAGLAPQVAEFMRSSPWYGLAQYGSLLGSPIMQDLGSLQTGTSAGKSSGFGFSL
jgi:hypothetical protein